MIPSSMTLEQYVEAHWLAMDPDLVRLIETTIKDFDNKIQEQAGNISEMYNLEEENADLESLVWHYESNFKKIKSIVETFLEGTISKEEMANFVSEVKV